MMLLVAFSTSIKWQSLSFKRADIDSIPRKCDRDLLITDALFFFWISVLWPTGREWSR